MAPMDLGRCRTCGRPVTPGEVTGMGILRPRPASAGGPVVELECPGCKTILTFIPHGNGRYAFPGQPPPPPPSAADRASPWQRSPRREGFPAASRDDDAPPTPPPPPIAPVPAAVLPAARGHAHAPRSAPHRPQDAALRGRARPAAPEPPARRS
jgi:hypothetical protein